MGRTQTVEGFAGFRNPSQAIRLARAGPPPAAGRRGTRHGAPPLVPARGIRRRRLAFFGRVPKPRDTMSKVYFYYSAMNAGKSTTLLQSSYNYQERGMRTLLFMPALDTR